MFVYSDPKEGPGGLEERAEENCKGVSCAVESIQGSGGI